MTTAAAIALAAVAGPAAGGGAGVKLVFVPQHVVQGTSAQVSAQVRPAHACSLRVRYSDGSLQPGLAAALPLNGVVSWTWPVPTTAQAGAALATVTCGRAGSVSRRLVVVGRLVAPRIVVTQTGFSTRPSFAGTRLSYGVILHLDSTARDASSVTVQTNFVLADDHLLGTDTQHVSAIAAGSDYALGNTVTFPGSAPIARLEVVVQVGGFAPHALHLPTLANIHLVPEPSDPAWVGNVEGELQNTDPALTLTSASLSAVVFDASGNILGGGNGYAINALPPGARAFLQIGNGLDVIPSDKAASALVSLVPTWTN